MEGFVTFVFYALAVGGWICARLCACAMGQHR